MLSCVPVNFYIDFPERKDYCFWYNIIAVGSEQAFDGSITQQTSIFGIGCSTAEGAWNEPMRSVWDIMSMITTNTVWSQQSIGPLACPNTSTSWVISSTTILVSSTPKTTGLSRFSERSRGMSIFCFELFNFERLVEILLHVLWDLRTYPRRITEWVL